MYRVDVDFIGMFLQFIFISKLFDCLETKPRSMSGNQQSHHCVSEQFGQGTFLETLIQCSRINRLI
jgi:hypothetical protein